MNQPMRGRIQILRIPTFLPLQRVVYSLSSTKIPQQQIMYTGIFFRSALCHSDLSYFGVGKALVGTGYRAMVELPVVEGIDYTKAFLSVMEIFG